MRGAPSNGLNPVMTVKVSSQVGARRRIPDRVGAGGATLLFSKPIKMFTATEQAINAKEAQQ